MVDGDPTETPFSQPFSTLAHAPKFSPFTGQVGSGAGTVWQLTKEKNKTLRVKRKAVVFKAIMRFGV